MNPKSGDGKVERCGLPRSASDLDAESIRNHFALDLGLGHSDPSACREALSEGSTCALTPV